jgi:isocitrate lyase
MEQQANRAVMELPDLKEESFRYEETDDVLQIARYMLYTGADTIKLPNGFVLTNQGRKTDCALVPAQDVVRSLRYAQSLAGTLNVQPVLVASTAARRARTLVSDDDLRDRRFLTGLRTMDGRFGYCGGMDAVVNRALTYAQCADVVCYTSSEFNLAEMERFAAEVRAAFPGKELGFGYSPDFYDSHRKGMDLVIFQRNLRRTGYQYFFLNQLGSTTFLSFPEESPWAFFDDRAALTGPTLVDEDAWQFPISRRA